MTQRSISFSEAQTALTCPARHAFGYTGHLTGGRTLKPRQIAAILSDGRAWGAAAAAYNAFSGQETLDPTQTSFEAQIAAHEALRASYKGDWATQAELGVYIPIQTLVEQQERLARILDHYVATCERLSNLTQLEGEIDVPIPSRTGHRPSSIYRFGGFIDGFTVDELGNEWITEFKLRASLNAVKHIQLSRQIRWYAWARQQVTGNRIVGALVDERLNEAPKPARLVQGNKKGTYVPSHAKDQMTTPESYVALCDEFDVPPKPEVKHALGLRRWQQRVPIMFGPRELEESGKELVSAAKLIRDLDSGELYPIRNAQVQLCRSCRFSEICANPQDEMLVNSLFELREPKRLKEAV